MIVIEIFEPVAPDAIDQVRTLFRAFIAWHRAHHREDADLIDRCFDESAFEAELSSLAGKYAPPGGALLLARLDDAPAGCVALRRIDDDCREMKRMFVPPNRSNPNSASTSATRAGTAPSRRPFLPTPAPRRRPLVDRLAASDRLSPRPKHQPAWRGRIPQTHPFPRRYVMTAGRKMDLRPPTLGSPSGPVRAPRHHQDA